MAASHVTGAAAMLYAIGVNTPEAALDVLARTSRPLDKVHRGQGGAGIIRIDDALRRVIGRRGLWVGFVALLLTVWYRRFGTRKIEGSKPGMGGAYWLGILLGGTGLFFLPYRGISLGPLTPYLGYGFAHWYAPWFGVDSPTAALFYSALPSLVLVLATYPFRRLNRFAAGVAIGMAATLVVTAFGPMTLPGVPWWLLERLWLLGNAFVTLFAAYLAMRPMAR